MHSHLSKYFIFLLVSFSFSTVTAQTGEECGCGEYPASVTVETVGDPCSPPDLGNDDGSLKRVYEHECCMKRCKERYQVKLQTADSRNSSSNQVSNSTAPIQNSSTSHSSGKLSNSNSVYSTSNNTATKKKISQQYQNELSKTIVSSFDSEGNVNPVNFVQNLPSAGTETEAYTNLALTGVAVLGSLLFDNDNQESEAERIAKINEEKRQRWGKLKDGIGELNENNQKTGKWAYFYEGSTAPKSSGNYINGVKDGIWEFYEDQTYSKVMSKKFKEVIVYFKGQVKDKYQPIDVSYNITKETGVLSRQQTFTKHRGYYLINSKDKRTKYGLWEEYNDFGVNISSGYYNILGNETGLWTYGYEYVNGNRYGSFTRNYHPYFSVSYHDGLRIGIETAYYFNGNKKSEVFHHNEVGKSTMIKSFDKKGKFIKEEEINFSEHLFINDKETMDKLLESYNSYFSTSRISFGSKIDSIPIGVLQKLPNLNFLEVSTTKMDEEDYSDIAKLNSITELYILSENDNFTEIPKDILAMRSLNKLIIRKASLGRLSNNIGNQKNLVKLILWGNEIEFLSDGVTKLTNLEELDLSINRISFLPDDIANLTELKVLKLNNNQIEQLPDNIGALTKLTELNLRNNKLSKLPSSFKNLINLQKLNLRNNPIEKLPQGFENLINLKTLVLDKGDKKKFKPQLELLKKNNKSIDIAFW